MYFDYIIFFALALVVVNLAVALAKACQQNVGLLDADIYGPSIPTMMNIFRKPEVSEGAILFLNANIFSTVNFIT